MKQKILLLLLIFLGSFSDSFCQCATTLIAGGGTSGNARCPMPRHRNSRVHYLITAAEMAAAGFGVGNTVDGISWNYTTAPAVSALGNLKVYLENTADVNNVKGTDFPIAIAPMTLAHSAPTLLPAAAGFFTVNFSGGLPFTYTGGGVYVAFDWDYCVGTLDAVCIAGCNTSLANGLQGSQNLGACNAPTVLAVSSFRPDTRFISTVANDVKADYIYTMGEFPLGFAPNHVVQAKITNRSNTVFTNYNVTLDVLGANSFTDVQTIGSLGACATATVTFLPYTPTDVGQNTVRVTLPADNNNLNNLKEVLQDITKTRYNYRYVGETPVTGVGFNGATGAVCAKFTTTTPLTLTHVNLQFNSVALPYKLAIYPDNAGVPSTVPLYIDAVDRFTTNFPASDEALNTPVLVPAGNFYVSIHQTGTTNAAIIYASESPLRTGSLFFASPAPPALWSDLGPGNAFRTLIGVKFCHPFQPDSIFGDTDICAGTTNTYSVTPDPEVISYTWSLPGGWSGISATNTISATAGNTGGNITCIANYICGSSSAKTLTVNVSDPLFTTFVSTNVLCNGAGNGQIAASSGPGATFAISPAATQAPIGTFINLVPNTYTVTLTDAASCTITSTAVITEPTVLGASATSGLISCNGGTTTLTGTESGGTGPFSYQWIDGGVSNNVTINPLKDNNIYEESPANSNGLAAHFVAGNNGFAFAGRALMAFDIAANVPAGSTITSATLQLHVSQANPGAGPQSHFLHKLLENWGEGTSNGFPPGAGAAATLNDATWLKSFFPATDWATQGGSFTGASTATTIVDGVGFYSWTSGQMASDIQNWLNYPATNYGWLLKGVETAATQAKRYDSKDNATPANRPALTINYFTPNVIGNTAVLNNVSAGTYTLVITDANGCTATSVITVTQPAPVVVTASASPNTTCNNTSVTANGGGALTYVWSGGISDGVPFIATATTTYSVTGTDGSGCTGTSSVTVTVNPGSGNLAPTTSNQSQLQDDDFDIDYYDASCNLIASVDDGAGGNILGITTATVNVDALAGSHNGQPFVRRWYQITPASNGSADVVLYVNQSDFDDYNNVVVPPYLPMPLTGNNADPNIPNIRITKNDDGGLGNNPVEITPTVFWNGTYWELSFNTPSFSQFRIHGANPGGVPLPVNITEFSGEKLENSSRLTWITGTEHQNDFFTLQHSSDGVHFSTIAKIKTAAPDGNSSSPIKYSTLHQEPVTGHNYYRLQQTDIDNKTAIHAKIVDLIWGTNGSSVIIYPNPAKDVLNVDLNASKAQNTTVKILDMSGRVIKQIQAKSIAGFNKISISLNEVAEGLYTIQVYENEMLTHTGKVRKEE